MWVCLNLKQWKVDVDESFPSVHIKASWACVIASFNYHLHTWLESPRKKGRIDRDRLHWIGPLAVSVRDCLNKVTQQRKTQCLVHGSIA